MLQEGDDENLLELYHHLFGRQESSLTEAAASAGPWALGLFGAFLSHDTRDKKDVALLKVCLAKYAIDTFGPAPEGGPRPKGFVAPIVWGEKN